MMSSITKRYPALGAPLYRRYWVASLASVGATQLLMLGQGWVVFDKSGSTFDLGVLGAATSIPAILMTLVGGALADRFEKRRVLLVTSTCTALLCAVLFALVLTDTVAVWHVWSIAALTAIVSGVDWPTRQSLFPHLIDRSMLLSAVALNSILWQATRMVMPVFGGILLAIDMSSVFLVGTVGYLVMTAVLLGMDVSVPGSRAISTFEQVKEGIRFIGGHRLFKYLLALSFGGMLFATSYTTLMPAFAHLLDADETGYGLLLSISGAGSIIGTGVIGALQIEKSYGTVILGGALASAIALVMFAMATLIPSFWLAAALVGVASAFTSVFMVLLMTALQVEVPDMLRGRVMGIHSITYSLMPLGGLGLGALAVYTGAPLAVMISVTVFIGIVAVIATSGEVRGLDGRVIDERATAPA